VAVVPSARLPWYPLRADPSEQKQIEEIIERTRRSYFRDTLLEIPEIRARIANCEAKRANLGMSTLSDVLFMETGGSQPQTHYQAGGVPTPDLLRRFLEPVLLVHLRYGWGADEVLALWQNEGLPTWRLRHFDEAGAPWVPMREVYRLTPQSQAEALAFSRSIILYQYWGLDVLTPITPQKGEDNVLMEARHSVHDRVFTQTYETMLEALLGDNPLSELTGQGAEVETRGKAWHFRSRDPEGFHATWLALQHARFKFLELNSDPKKGRVIPPSVTVDGATVSLRPIFPALIYVYFNAKYPENTVRLMARAMISSQRTKKKSYESNELYKAFIEQPLQAQLREFLIKGGRLAHSYMNALRFEYLRLIYAELLPFEGTSRGFWPIGQVFKPA